VLLNSTHSPEAMRRITALALRYLKADVELPTKPEAQVGEAVLREYEGYYHQANPRNQALAFIDWLTAGQNVAVNGNRLEVSPVFGADTSLIPVSNNLFRFEADPEASRVFTADDAGTMVLTGGSAYLERRSRWRVDVIRWPVLVSVMLCLTPLLMMLPWIAHARRAEPSGFWWLKLSLLACSIALVLPAAATLNASVMDFGTQNIRSVAVFAGSILLPTAAILSFLFTVDAFLSGAGRWLKGYALVASTAALIVSGYLSAWGMIAFLPWAY
jgi:hypothetical protein